ncbi:MAG: FAD-dependent monooxygenase [Balneolaceae bacterium]|nr:FAD-dependent monooxygenase [Balneolaceae bacterium]
MATAKKNHTTPITIIGGGIGGLSLANTLAHFNIQFQLYEQAPELTDVGAGIGLSEAPLKILDKLGLGSDIGKAGAIVRHVYMPDKQLKIRRKLSVSSETICIHRARLIDILKNRLPESCIHLSKKVTGIDVSKSESTITFNDGSRISTACTVAADGIHSVIRRKLLPHIRVRYINQTIWRGISDLALPELFKNSFLEIWDQRLRFLVIPLDDVQTLWLAAKPELPGGKDDPKTVREDLLYLYRDFHPALKDLIRSSKNVLRNDMNDLGTKKRPWYVNSVVFLGDSIHATTPNLAQGGCQAIEDAWCLAFCLDKHGTDYQKAFQAYQNVRESKVMNIVKTSWVFGKAAHSKNPLFHYGYRSILTHAPEFFLRRQESFLNDLSYLQKL